MSYNYRIASKDSEEIGMVIEQAKEVDMVDLVANGALYAGLFFMAFCIIYVMSEFSPLSMWLFSDSTRP